MEYSDIRKSLVFEVNNSKQQFIYYILGLSTACIAYLIIKIDNSESSDHINLLLFQIFGITFFALSVLFGMKYVRFYQNYMSKEIDKIDILTNSPDSLVMQTLKEVLKEQISHLHQEQYQQFQKNSIITLEDTMTKLVSKYNQLYRWTLNMFYIGIMYTTSLVILQKLDEKYNLGTIFTNMLSYF